MPTGGPIDIVSASTAEMRKRYGFIYIDKDNDGNVTLQRIKKDSFAWYQHLIETNGVFWDAFLEALYMSLIASILFSVVLAGRPIYELPAIWVGTFLKNFPMAFFWNMFAAAPFCHWVFDIYNARPHRAS